MTPLVSVIIPTFNRADLLGEAIESALRQTLRDKEVVVVDDGSTDSTEEVVGRYHGVVRYIRTRHGGVAYARNVGTRQARGRFLTFLDSDDRLYPYALELLAGLLGRLPQAAFVCAEMSGFDDHGFFERYHLKKYHSSTYRDSAITYERIFGCRTPLGELGIAPGVLVDEDPASIDRGVYSGNVFDMYLLDLVLCQNTVMLRSEAAAEAGDRDERIAFWEEFDYLLRICRNHEVGFVDVPTYQLRYHEGQISTTARPNGKYVWMRKQQALLRVIKRHAFADRSYYERHRKRIDAQLARLHRAVAVPMMLAGTRAAGRTLARRSRVYLSGSQRYGRTEWSLWLTSYLPGPARRLGVTVIERVRNMRAKARQRVPPLAA